MSLVKLAIAWFAKWFGERSGKAEQLQADQVAATQQEVKVDHAVIQADAAAPRNRTDLARGVREGTDF